MAVTPPCIIDPDGPFIAVVVNMGTLGRSVPRIIVTDTDGWFRADVGSVEELRSLGINMANITVRK